MATAEIKKLVGKVTTFRVEKPPTAEEVARQQAAAAEQARKEAEAKVVSMHEKVERPEMLVGSTYKIKTPVSDHAMYITINDIVLNEGTPHEQRRPFEIFINSKNMDNFQWMVALTRVASAVFRKGGDVTFLVDELKGVFDPKGGYWKQGGTFMPSTIAELGYVIEKHLQSIGLLAKPELTVHQKELVAKKRAEYDVRSAQEGSIQDSGYPPHATLCGSCHAKACVVMDGCEVCLSCAASKCG